MNPTSPNSIGIASYLRTTPVACAALLFVGCEEEPKLPGDDVVLATVGEGQVTQYDVERALDKSLGKFATKSVERGAREEVTESLIQSRAMAQLAEEELEPEERLVLEKEVAAYRESLLVKQYLQEENPPEPVTPADIKEYYDKNAALFGATTERKYELIFGKRPVAGNTRVELLKRLTTAAKEEDWKLATSETEGAPELGFSTGVTSEKALHSKLKELLNGLESGRPSKVVFIQGRAYVGRVTGEVKGKAKPLAEVSDDIRRSLSVVRARDAIREVGAEATKKVKVTRHKVKQQGDGDE